MCTAVRNKTGEHTDGEGNGSAPVFSSGLFDTIGICVLWQVRASRHDISCTDISQMMDIEEAKASLDNYANLLDAQCQQYNFAASLAGSTQKTKEREVAKNVLKRSVADLRRTQNEATVLRILIAEAIKQEAKRLFRSPGQLAELIEAEARTTVAFNMADSLLRQHDKKENDKDRPRRDAEALKEFEESLNRPLRMPSYLKQKDGETHSRADARRRWLRAHAAIPSDDEEEPMYLPLRPE
jgi:hypothetical protein